MARRRRFKYVIDPFTVAAAAVTNFKAKVTTDLKGMAERYQSNIKAYIEDEAKQISAIIRMGAFYAGIRSPEVRSKIREAVASAKAEANKLLAELEKAGKIPATVPKGTEVLTRKVAEILTGVRAGAS